MNLFGEIQKAGEIVPARRNAREPSDWSLERDGSLRHTSFVGSTSVDEPFERGEQRADLLRLVAQVGLDRPHRGTVPSAESRKRPRADRSYVLAKAHSTMRPRMSQQVSRYSQNEGLSRIDESDRRAHLVEVAEDSDLGPVMTHFVEDGSNDLRAGAHRSRIAVAPEAGGTLELVVGR